MGVNCLNIKCLGGRLQVLRSHWEFSVLALEAKTKQDQSQTKVTSSMFPLIQLVLLLLLLLLTALTKLRSKLACCPRPQRIDQESGSRLGRPARQGSGIHRRPSEPSRSQTRRRIHLTLSSSPKSTRTRTLKATGIRDQHSMVAASLGTTARWSE